ncbi:hypothetical protein GGI11_000336 [Coemansia sp. RSA 2049]|nr:hypothetical protein H4217_000661 [Coemansia sp. RSA 1939]KAJ2525102.1 hypothetical protein GGI11_000336 [Coemansia sp. RSA 2049]KAJ2604195.1 hypothetical protein EV177_006486 [Coemansia sp. RSA 1804]KAJ2687694.1 hypothetical protein GGH99_003208 [Coemansia sp. RSA 1285]
MAPPPISADQWIGGVLLLALSGFYLLARKSMALHLASVFVASAAASYAASLAIYMPSAANHARRTAYVVLSVVVGIQSVVAAHCAAAAAAAAASCCCCFSLFPRRNVARLAGRLVHGGVAGTAFALYLFGMSPAGGLVESAAARAALAATLSGLLAAANAVCPPWMDSACAAVLGAYFFAVGADCFARSGYLAHAGVFFFGAQRSVIGAVGYLPPVPQNAFALQAAALLLAATVGGALRWWLAARRFRTKMDDDQYHHHYHCRYHCRLSC